MEETEKETELENGTSIRFTPDEAIFNDFKYVEDIIFQILRNATYLNEDLDIIFNGTRMRHLKVWVNCLQKRNFIKVNVSYIELT